MKYAINSFKICILGSILFLGACSSSWLETIPTGSASEEEVLESTNNAKQAINGICKLMSMQHAYYGQGFNGEGTIMMMYAEYMGQDFQNPIYAPGWATLMNGDMTQQNTRIYDAYPWFYYYTIIGNANAVLGQIDNVKGEEAERKFLKAEALTFRAYAYTMLVQFYCDAWKGSNNGATNGVALRIDTSMGDLPLSTLAECYTQIYDDLNNAITLFKESNLSVDDVYAIKNNASCFPDINVAYATYARAALNREDYAAALANAKLAREGHALMSVTDYKSGFCTPNSEWIWGTYNDAAETLYYWSFQVSMAYNGNNAKNGYSTTINRKLVDAFPATDIRKGLFLNKDVFCSEGQKVDDLVELTGYGDFKMHDKNNEIDKESAGYKAYVKANTYAKANCKYTPFNIEFPYASLKFACTSLPGVGCVPILRSSEMLLIEAEANYFLNNTPATIQNNLKELNATSGRDAAYTCTKTGEELLNEIIQYRRLELWGEGHSWFDCKRWKINVERPELGKGGNFHAAIAGTYGDEASFWKWIIPAKETDYNSAIKTP